MTVPSPVGFLDFFVLEASDYIDQLDAQLKAGGGGLDADALQRAARALRGSATMAKLPAFAEMAAASSPRWTTASCSCGMCAHGAPETTPVPALASPS